MQNGGETIFRTNFRKINTALNAIVIMISLVTVPPKRMGKKTSFITQISMENERFCLLGKYKDKKPSFYRKIRRKIFKKDHTIIVN